MKTRRLTLRLAVLALCVLLVIPALVSCKGGIKGDEARDLAEQFITLLGDGKYGKLDKRFDRNYQALYSYKLTFLFTTDAGALEYLNGKSFQVAEVDFVKEYFPDIKM